MSVYEDANASAAEKLFDSLPNVNYRPSLYAVFLNFLLYQKQEPAPLVRAIAAPIHWSTGHTALE